MDPMSLENLRWVIVGAAFVAVFVSLGLVEKYKPGYLRTPRIRVFDTIVTTAVFSFLGMGLVAYWHEKEDVVTAKFHQQYHDNWWPRTGGNTFFQGVPLLKCPLDLWVFQEIVYERRPDVILETGTWRGGTSFHFASLFDLMGTDGRVVTVDINDFETPEHERITYLIGSSTADEIMKQIRATVHPEDKVMVVLDSDHSKQHVLNELNLYSKLVTPGQYLVVEDTHLTAIRSGQAKGTLGQRFRNS